jgi:hypothetical protein
MMRVRGGLSWPRLLLAALCVLVGLVWLGQGVGLIGGSAMTGSSFWAVVGVVLIVVGAWFGWHTWQGRPTSR